MGIAWLVQVGHRCSCRTGADGFVQDRRVIPADRRRLPFAICSAVRDVQGTDDEFSRLRLADALPRSDIFSCMLSLTTCFWTARMRIWLVRNSGKALGPQCWHISRKSFFEGLDRLFDNTTWAMIGVFSAVAWQRVGTTCVLCHSMYAYACTICMHSTHA